MSDLDLAKCHLGKSLEHSRRAAWSLEWGDGPLVVSWEAAAEHQDLQKADDLRPVRGDERGSSCITGSRGRW